ncbi:MAG: hypothetical protein ACJ74O_06300 [Frankiaceae bacterium]
MRGWRPGPRSWREQLIGGVISFFAILIGLQVLGVLIIHLLGPFLPLLLGLLILAVVLRAIVRRY